MSAGALLRPVEPGIAGLPPWVVFTPYVFHDTSVRMPDTDTDEVLLAAAQRGDSEARGELFERCRPNMVALACKKLGPTREAEAHELVQDAFGKAHERLDQFKGDSKVSTWLYRITVNTCLDRKRQGPPPGGREIDGPVGDGWDPPAGSDVDPERRTLDGERAELIRRAFATLPTDERTVLLLQTYKDKTNSEIAHLLNWPLGTVKTRLRNAKIRMRDALRELGLTPEDLRYS